MYTSTMNDWLKLNKSSYSSSQLGFDQRGKKTINKKQNFALYIKVPHTFDNIPNLR